MCLFKKHFLPRISRKPIKCYKVLEASQDGAFYTPYTFDKSSCCCVFGFILYL